MKYLTSLYFLLLFINLSSNNIILTSLSSLSSSYFNNINKSFPFKNNTKIKLSRFIELF